MRTVVAMILMAAAMAGAAQPQAAYQAPRTAEGRPDFQGLWTMRFITPVERPSGVPGPEVTPQQAPDVIAKLVEALTSSVSDPDFDHYALRNLLQVGDSLRSSVIVAPANGLMPLTPAGQASSDEYDRLFFTGFDNPEERDNFERCLAGTTQAPIRPLPIPMPLQIVQTPTHVVLLGEDVQSLRIIEIGGRKPPAAVRSREGWSNAQWEGETLVVTTTHLRADDPWRPTIGRSLLVGPDSRVVERITRVAVGELKYEFTIEDPVLYASPWRGEFSLRLGDVARVYEYACHEANYSLANMLSSGREAERRSRKK